MNRIDKKFKELKRDGKKAFIAYITAGDPSLAISERIVLELEKSGVDIIELGIPFSDPVADGPTIQAASQRALAKGANLKKIFAMVYNLRRKTKVPIVFMTYFNPVFKFGLAEFFKTCRKSGVDGVIIPDLSIEEAQEAIALGKASGVAVIFLVAPTSPRSRIEKIAAKSKGFIYYVSLTGVTGARTKLPSDVAINVRCIKSITDKPVAVGFGVSDAKQARSIAKVADGVIVGSAIVKIISRKENAILKVSKLARGLAAAIHGE
jgi:tryptophan synthase alpha chain